MTGNNITLDTGIVIELFKGNTKVLTRLGNQQIVDIPHLVLAELLLGAYRSSNPDKHLSQIRNFVKRCNILPADAATSDFYARVKVNLLRKGKPIPENDIWIAAIAMQYKLTLVTLDKHFYEVEGLTTDNWNS